MEHEKVLRLRLAADVLNIYFSGKNDRDKLKAVKQACERYLEATEEGPFRL